MTILKQLVETVRELITNKIFWIGFVVCFAVFSQYIFGPDNLLEQIGEKLARDYFGIETDFSPEVPRSVNNE